MKIIPARGLDPPIIPSLTPLQLRLLDLLGIATDANAADHDPRAGNRG